MAYQFDTQLYEGNKGERYLDRFFAYWYGITPATYRQQRQGIDRVFTCRYFGQSFTVEYKTDKRAARSGNAFIETLSVSTTGKRGWAYTSQAAFIVYYIPGTERVFILDVLLLRANLLRWCNTYPTRSIPNRGYTTEGLLVPLAELERVATWHGIIE